VEEEKGSREMVIRSFNQQQWDNLNNKKVNKLFQGRISTVINAEATMSSRLRKTDMPRIC
jgi:hypothetical protein